MTDALYVLLDTSHPEGREMFEQYGELIDGVPVLMQERAGHPADPGCMCESCGTTTTDAWALKHDDAGIPVCGECLADYPWARRVVRTQHEIGREAQKAGQ